MFLGQLVTRLANRVKVGENANDENSVPIRSRLTAKLNEAYIEIAHNYRWEHLKRTSEIQTTPNYITGTVNIVNASNKVTGSGTVWTANMQGRYFMPQTGTNWYKISYVDTVGQILYLVQPMIEPTANAQTYAIWQRYYYLHSDVDKIFEMGAWIKNGQIQEESNRYIRDVAFNIASTGQPDFFSMYGVNPIESAYSTGTATIPLNSNIMTGSGTAWQSNVEPGELVLIGNSTFRVKRVENDTRIALLNYADKDFTQATTYTISKDNPVGFQYYYNADKQYNFPYIYYKRVFNMVNETNDKPEFPEKFDLAILDGAEMGWYRDFGATDKWQIKQTEYKARIIDLHHNAPTSVPRGRMFYPQIPFNARHPY